MSQIPNDKIKIKSEIKIEKGSSDGILKGAASSVYRQYEKIMTVQEAELFATEYKNLMMKYGVKDIGGGGSYALEQDIVYKGPDFEYKQQEETVLDDTSIENATK